MKSASFRNRIRESFKTADLLGLETGVGTRSRVRKTKLGRALRKAKVVANSPTLVGDIMGVMGYMSAYRANLRNGMSEQEALEKFNSYNETQQTRRPTEKVGIQRSNSVFARSFTMFGSTFYLQLNKIMQSVTNISRDGVDALKLAKNKEFKDAYKQSPKTKDYRELVLNLSIANFLFTAIANAFKYNPFMDDDDEITEDIQQAVIGLTQLKQKLIPIFRKSKIYIYSAGTIATIILFIFKSYMFSFICFILFVPDWQDVYRYIRKTYLHTHSLDDRI